MKLLVAYPPAELLLADELRRAKALFDSGDTLGGEDSVDEAIEQAEVAIAPISFIDLIDVSRDAGDDDPGADAA
jgi:hypothetical protein